MRILPILSLLLLPALAVADEYFLDNDQRLELLMQGRITGRDSAQYNVWIVPGYQPPMRNVDKGWRAARKDLADYGDPVYYDRMVDVTRTAMRFARKDVMREFALQGTSEAWRESSITAQERVRRRVFGWWFAWPWALVEASAESVVRVGAGVPGGTLIWGGSAVFVPLGFMAWPATISAAHALGQGTAYPLAAVTWNTMIAPPLALAGEQPSPERADGWWMKRLQDPAEADIRARVAGWQRSWHGDEALTAQRTAMTAGLAGHKARIDALRAELEAAEKEWASAAAERSAGYRQEVIAKALAALPALRGEMAAQGYSQARLQAQRDMLLEEMVTQGLDREAASRVISAWLGSPDILQPAWQHSERTDPLQQVIERAPPH